LELADLDAVETGISGDGRENAFAKLADGGFGA
jgi:hypothetical protein